MFYRTPHNDFHIHRMKTSYPLSERLKTNFFDVQALGKYSAVLLELVLPSLALPIPGKILSFSISTIRISLKVLSLAEILAYRSCTYLHLNHLTKSLRHSQLFSSKNGEITVVFCSYM